MPILSLDEAIRQGIRPDSDVGVSEQYFNHFTGLQPTRWGAKPLETISTPTWTGYAGTPSHPLPQLFRGRGVTLLVDDQEIYEVTESSGNWTATNIDKYQGNIITGANTFERGWRIDYSGPGEGTPWHFVDMYSNWMLIRPGEVIFKTGQAGGQVYVCTDVTIGTGCDFRDSRVLLGGFDSSDIYAMADWNAYWATQYDNAPDEVKSTLDALGTTGPGGNWVQYGSIGGGDLLWFMSIELMKKGILNRDQLANGRLTSGTNWTTTGWTVLGAGSGIQHNTGNTSSLAQAVASQDFALAINTTYRVRFTLGSTTAGYVNVKVAGTTTTNNFGANGDKDFEFTTPGSGTLDFEFVPISTFDGIITNVSMQVQPSNSFGDNYLIDLMQRNEFGFTPMPYQGDVCCLKPLGDAVIAYGEENSSGKNGGIVALRAHDKFFGQFPPMNIGSGVGVLGRGAVGGDETHHAFIDETGELWLMGQDLVAERLGYQQIFEGWIGEDVSVGYNPRKDEFWFTATPSGSAETFVLNKNGLCAAGQHPTTLFVAQGALVGMLDGGTTDDNINLITQGFDATMLGGNRRDFMVVHGVLIGTTDIDAGGWKILLRYRQNVGDDWTDTPQVAIDGRGYAQFGVPCYEAKVRLIHPDVTDTSGIDTLHVDLELNGKPGSRQWYDAAPPGPAVL